MVDIKTTSIPAKPRSKNYPAGAVITRTTGGVAVNGGGGGGASVDIVKAADTKSFTDSNVLSSLRTLLEIRSRIIAESDTTTELTDDNTLSSKRTLKEIDAAIKEALKKLDDVYLSKVKADTAAETITFLKGLLIGNDLAFINESGDAELQSLVARMKVKAATLEVTGSASVGTLHSEGNISTGADIWAKGDTHTLNLLVQALAKTYDLNVEHVATLFQTIVKDYISSERFIPGLMGEGMKLYKAINGDWNLEIDNAVVRKAMTIFELIISKVRAVNGGLVISSANGRVKSVSETSGDPAYYVLGIEGDMMFVADDLVRCQVYTSGHVKYYWVPVASVNDDSILILKSVFPNGTVPAVGDDLVQMGNLTNPNRQGILYLTASEDGKPRISVLDGVNSTSLAGKNKVILGCLDGMTDTDFLADFQPSGYGLYAINCFLKGIFILRNGKSVEDEVNQAKQDAADAATEAGKAQQTAREAKDRLNKWADDGLISPPEKPALIDEGKRIKAEHLSLLADAGKYGISATVYTQAYNDYLGQLQYHSESTPENIVILAGLAESQTTYYNQRNLILSAIADAAKAYVDEADKRLKEHIDTEISAIPGKIELAVRSLKIADTNLLSQGYVKRSEGSYLMAIYPWSEHLTVGKTYTLTVCYKCGSKTERLYGYNNPSFGPVTAGDDMTSKTEEVKSIKITPSNEDNPTGFHFYKNPQNDDDSYIKWAVITDGNLGVTSWMPSASEKNVGLKNLCSFKRITDAGFTYALKYEDNGMIDIWVGRLNDETNAANKDMFGLTYSPNKQYFVFVDNYDPKGANEILVIYIKYTDGTQDQITCNPSRIDGNYLLTTKSVSKITGTYYYGYNVSVRIGVFETSFPVSWSPAPEDQLYQSVKYTDTRILAVDGKIELSVKTKVENLGIGANNLYSYTSSQLNTLREAPQIVERLLSEHGFCLVGAQSGNSSIRIPNIIPPIPGKYTVSGWIKGSQSSNPGITIDVCDSVDKFTIRATTDNQWKYFKHTFNATNNTEAQSNIYNFVDIENISWAYIYVKDFKVEAGEIATAWSPNEQDGVYKSEDYTNQKISIVEGKITSTVEKVNEVDGKVTGLSSRVTQTESSINSVVGDVNVLKNTTDRHVTKQIDLTGWDNNKFFPLIISMQTYHKSKVEISRPLDAGYGKPSYGTHEGGFSMNLTFEMSGSGWGSLPAVTNIFDYTRAWSTGPIVFDLGQITESSTCVMGIRGGSKYDVTVYDTIDPNVINVYQTDYHGSYNTSFPVRTDGTEPVRTYGYYTEIKQTQESIALTANKVDDQGRRLSAAELTLSSDHAKLSVVEQTANSANSLAGTANGKAEAANSLAGTANSKANAVDGRVTATQNGLVETGINITSRKIVLKSDNVLFQNNAGQQTAAINANGKLSANVIEAAEVVAQAFSAQRITTGNLTVTDGAYLGGWQIKNNAIYSRNVADAKIQLEISGTRFLRINQYGGAPTSGGFPLMEIRNDNQDCLSLSTYGQGGKALKIIANSEGGSAIQSHGSHLFGQRASEKWNAPGMLCTGYVYQAGTVTNKWGNGCTLTDARKIATGKYRIYHNLNHTQYAVLVQGLGGYGWVFGQVETQNNSYFEVLMLDSNKGPRDCEFLVFVVGRNVW